MGLTCYAKNIQHGNLEHELFLENSRVALHPVEGFLHVPVSRAISDQEPFVEEWDDEVVIKNITQADGDWDDDEPDLV